MKPALRRSLLAVALAASAALALWGQRAPAEVPAQAAPPVPRIAAAAPAGSPALLPLAERHRLIAPVPGHGRTDLFEARLPLLPVPAAAPVTQTEPGAPPLPFAYLGKQFDGQAWQLFLKREGGEVMVLREGDEIDGQYRVTAVSAEAATLLYLPLQQAQTLVFE